MTKRHFTADPGPARQGVGTQRTQRINIFCLIEYNEQNGRKLA